MLTLQNVTGGYGDTTVLRDVSIDVPDSSVVALLGPNGAGKSTTLRMAAGLLRPKEGTVLFDGADVTKLGPYQRARRGICLIPEGRGIFPSLTVRENLVMHVAKRQQREAYERAVDTFGVLGERRSQIAGTLSGGEQQMLALVRAYVANPKVVLIDEASLGLAPLIVDAIFEFIEHLADEGTSLLIVEQYISRALALASAVYLLNQGTIVYSGPADGLDEETVFALYTGEDSGASEPPLSDATPAAGRGGDVG
jgi:branched-chain amino acid transport system ATP-binding protein